MHCYSPEKIGRDAGELAGLGPNGVTATGTVEEIIAARPDVLTFHGVFPDEDLYVKVLEAGINIVTTADWITGWHRDRNHPHPSGKSVTRLLAEACEKGRATFYGTGMNPGLNQILGVVCSADVAEIENVTTIESVDVSCHHSRDTWIEVGYGQPVDDPEIPLKLEKYTRVFADSVLMMADCFDLPSMRSRSAMSWAPAPRTSTWAGTRCPRARWAATTSSIRAWSTAFRASRRTWSGR